MPDYYKIKSQDEKIFYLRSTVEEQLMFDVLSQKKFSQYRTWDKDEREKFKEDFRKHENQFPIQVFWGMSRKLYVNHICVKHIDYFLCVFVVENIISEISSMLNFFMP